MLCAIELLVSQREACRVLKDNSYMFARPAAETHFRGSDCLRGFAKACGAKCPKALTSTKLRKHAATLSTVLNMTDIEMDQLANFLGHDIRIHREFYRLPEKTLQLAKISKLLMALEQGRLAEFHGKNLDEITIGPDGRFYFYFPPIFYQNFSILFLFVRSHLLAVFGMSPTEKVLGDDEEDRNSEEGHLSTTVDGM